MALSPAAAALLANLRAHTENTTEEADGSRWGSVYLPNVGKGHSFAGHLSALEAASLYRRTGDSCFGEVLLAPVAPADRWAALKAEKPGSKAAWAALKTALRAARA